MSTKLVYHCDRTQNHSLSYEKKAGETTDPVAAGWLAAELQAIAGQPHSVLVRIMCVGEVQAEGFLHFCSLRCFTGWLEKTKALTPQDQPAEEEPN